MRRIYINWPPIGAFWRWVQVWSNGDHAKSTWKVQCWGWGELAIELCILFGCYYCQTRMSRAVDFLFPLLCEFTEACRNQARIQALGNIVRPSEPGKAETSTRFRLSHLRCLKRSRPQHNPRLQICGSAVVYNSTYWIRSMLTVNDGLSSVLNSWLPHCIQGIWWTLRDAPPFSNAYGTHPQLTFNSVWT